MRRLSRLTEWCPGSACEVAIAGNGAVRPTLHCSGAGLGCPPALIEAAIQAIRGERGGCPQGSGSAELRQAISEKAEWYNRILCDPETEITITCGATGAIAAALSALTNPGDEVILFEPFCEAYRAASVLAGVTVRYVSLHPPRWCFDPDDLARAFGDKTKAILVNSPANPTGKAFTREEMDLVAALCLKWDVYAIADEVYEHLVFDGAQHISIAALPGMAERTVTANSISVTYGAGGWRVGWAIAEHSISSRIRAAQHCLTYGAPAPLQCAATAALRMPRSYYTSLQAHYTRARGVLVPALLRAGFRCREPQGACYVLADASQVLQRLGLSDSLTLCRLLCEEAGVVAAPGSAFYAVPHRGGRLIRFCYRGRWEALTGVEEALCRLTGLPSSNERMAYAR